MLFPLNYMYWLPMHKNIKLTIEILSLLLRCINLYFQGCSMLNKHVKIMIKNKWSQDRLFFIMELPIPVRLDERAYWDTVQRSAQSTECAINQRINQDIVTIHVERCVSNHRKNIAVVVVIDQTWHLSMAEINMIIGPWQLHNLIGHCAIATED